MDRIPPSKKRTREDDIPLPPAHRPTPPSASHTPAVRPSPVPGDDDGKALRRREVQTGAGPHSDPVAAPRTSGRLPEGRASTGLAADAPPAFAMAEADIPDGATVRVSDGSYRVYPRAQLVATETGLTMCRNPESSSGLFTQEMYEYLVLALVGPRRAAPDGQAGGLPSATALVRLDTMDDNYVTEADEAVREFESQAGRPISVRVVSARSALKLRLEAASDDAVTLLRSYRSPSHPPRNLSENRLHNWVVRRIVAEHNARADALAMRYDGPSAIAARENAILLTPDGELVTFRGEPRVELAPAPSSGHAPDAAPAARGGDDKGPRAAQVEGPRPGRGAPPRAPGGLRADPEFQGLAPFSRPAGPPDKPPQ